MAEKEALQAQVDWMRWRGQLPERLPRLTLRGALRRIRCAHRGQGLRFGAEGCVYWCRECGHAEVRLAPKWLPESSR